MQIVFICGSLEPGRDGVGDYTRRLAAELMKQGHQATIIALNERNICEAISVLQFQDNTEVKVLRLPFTLKGNSRFKLAKEWIDEHDPDLLSLQFVPFAFHSKGLAFKLLIKIIGIGSGRKWHIMFHELWVGMEEDSSFKEKIWGQIQKLLIRLLVYVVKPLCVHTQAKYYQSQLVSLGIEARYLPLFSNIPVLTNRDYQKALNTVSSSIGQNEISFVLFGGIYPGAPVKKFIEEVVLYAQNNHLRPVLTIIGRSSAEQERWAYLWRNLNLSVKILGELSEKSVSQILSASSLGISTNPYELSDKSGAVAAMREHGLPVICVRDEWKVKNKSDIPIPIGIINYKIGSFKENIKFVKTNAGGSKLSGVAKKFLEDILLKKQKVVKI